MPLEPPPPPSPHGKNPPQPQPSQPPSPKPKHRCLASHPCDICLSDIVPHLPSEYFPHPLYPPAVPKSILDYFTAHPFSWSWTTKAGPNAGKSFHVPHIPMSCKKSDHWAVQWTVDHFHLFKAHLTPQTLDAKEWVLAVISLNLTKSNPDLRLPQSNPNLRLPQSTSDHSDYSVHPWSPDLSPILDYSVYH